MGVGGAAAAAAEEEEVVEPVSVSLFEAVLLLFRPKSLEKKPRDSLFSPVVEEDDEDEGVVAALLLLLWLGVDAILAC